jgi:rhodanese-related sulfurtransferase
VKIMLHNDESENSPPASLETQRTQREYSFDFAIERTAKLKFSTVKQVRVQHFMKKIREMMPIGILAISILMQALLIQVAAVAADYRTNKSYRTCNTLSISPDEVLHKSRQKQALILVDVRPAEDFARLHIPGSLSIPLYAVKTKEYLKTSLLVLVNEGFQYDLLIDECRQLKDAGFAVRILDGGIAGWAQQRKVLAGDLFALKELRMILPQVFFPEKNSNRLTAINISPVVTEIARESMPDALHIPLTTGPLEWTRKLNRSLTNHRDRRFLSVLILSQTGQGYETASQRLAGLDVNAFYLQGGVAGYRRYLDDLRLSWMPRDRRIRTDKPCRICGEEVEENVVNVTTD